MKYAETSVLGTPEVLKRKLGAEYLKPIALDISQLSASQIGLPAGTAVTVDGKASKGDGSDVYGILLNDIYRENPNGSVIVASAVINSDNTTATAEDKAALASKAVLFE